MGKESKKEWRKRALACILGIVPFIILWDISRTYYPREYLFEWMMRRNYLYIWVIVCIVAFLKPWLAVTISLSDVISIVLGQCLGTWIRARNITKVTPDMDAEQVNKLYGNPGFGIWLVSFIVLLVAAVIVHTVYMRKKHKVSEE